MKSAEQRIAEAPRAWAVICDGRRIHGDDVFELKNDAEISIKWVTNARVIPVAIVELKPEEVR